MKQKNCNIYNSIINYIKDDLLITSLSDCNIVIEEDGETSVIKKVNVKPYCKEKTFIIKQDKNKKSKQDFTLDLLKEVSNCDKNDELKPWQTNKMCDFVVVECSKNNITKIYFCELKTTICEDAIEEAKLQIKASQFFLKCLFHALEDYCGLEMNFESINSGKKIFIYKQGKTFTSAYGGDIEPIQLTSDSLELLQL